MLISKVTLTPLVEGDCPACGHHAARRAEHFRLVQITPSEEAHPLTWEMSDWYLTRCRCGYAWLSSLVVGTAVEVRDA